MVIRPKNTHEESFRYLKCRAHRFALGHNPTRYHQLINMVISVVFMIFMPLALFIYFVEFILLVS